MFWGDITSVSFGDTASEIVLKRKLSEFSHSSAALKNLKQPPKNFDFKSLTIPFYNSNTALTDYYLSQIQTQLQQTLKITNKIIAAIK